MIMIACIRASSFSAGYHADRDPDRDLDHGGRPGLAGDVVPARAVAAPRRGPVLAIGLPERVGRLRHRSAALLNKQSFLFADYLNYNINNQCSPVSGGASNGVRLGPVHAGCARTMGTLTSDILGGGNNPGVESASRGGPGLPSPTTRSGGIRPLTLQPSLNGYYLDPNYDTTFEARFGSGIGFIRNDPDSMTGIRPAPTACSGSPISTCHWSCRSALNRSEHLRVARRRGLARDDQQRLLCRVHE